MEWNEWITLAFQASLFLTVLAVGLRASLRDILYLVRHPRALLVSFLSMAVIMPAFAIAISLILDLHPAKEIALVALSVSPIPPFLPLRIMKAGGKPSYTISLLALSSALSVFVIPLVVAVFSEIYPGTARISSLDILPVVLTTVLLPLGAGLAVRAFLPAPAARLAGLLPALGMYLLLGSLLYILFGLREALFDLVGARTLAVYGGFALLGFLVGDLLGGMKAEDRTVLAFATAMRHPGVALTVAHGRDATDQYVFAAVLMYLIVGILVSTAFMAGRRRLQGRSRLTPEGDPTGLRPA